MGNSFPMKVFLADIRTKGSQLGSGPNLIRPDFPELKQPFPFLWQQAEYVIGGAATYIFCVLAADRLLNG